MESNERILSAMSVHRVFQTAEGPLEVLRGIDLEIERGQTTAVCGASGVGKSTLLHILGGLDRPTRGEVSLD